METTVPCLFCGQSVHYDLELSANLNNATGCTKSPHGLHVGDPCADAVSGRSATEPRRACTPPILCRGVNIAEHVGAMFDALVGSLDWGSGFLDAETIESILIVAELAGFEVPESPGTDEAPPGSGLPELSVHEDSTARAEAIATWRKQVQAKARTLAAEVE